MAPLTFGVEETDPFDFFSFHGVLMRYLVTAQRERYRTIFLSYNIVAAVVSPTRGSAGFVRVAGRAWK